VRRLLDWCRSHPWTTAIAGFVCFGAGLHFFLNWRSERAWELYSAEARARGVKLTLAEIAIPEIPDEENFAAIPILKAAFANGKRPFELPLISGAGRLTFGDIIKGQRTDWTTWQETFMAAGYLTEATHDPVRDTLRGLDHFTPAIEEWQQWRTRPKSRFPLNLNLGASLPLPHLGTFQNAAFLFSARMRLHLALGDSAAAYEDFRDGFQAYLALREEPTLIDDLVRISVIAIVIGAVGEGLGDHAWAEGDLRKIQRDLSQVHMWVDYRRAMETEHAFVNSFMEPMVTSPAARVSLFGSPMGTTPSPGSLYMLRLIPGRVYRDNQLRQNHMFDEMLARVSPSGEEYDLDLPIPSSPRNLNGTLEAYYFFSLRMLGPVEMSIDRKHIQARMRIDHARLVCGLERFWLARGAYPAALEELVPAYIEGLPIDIYSKSPYRYARTPGGSFRLYSVGEDRIDNGGVLDRQKREKDQTDAIWFYAPLEAAP
jgi:hypothetical protein